MTTTDITPALLVIPEDKSIASGMGGPADLVLEGGGVKGIGLAGVILALDEAGYEFRRVAGTSAGAVVATIVAALNAKGQPLSRLRDFMEGIDYSEFTHKSRLRAALGKVGDAERLLLHMGLYDGDYLIDWLGGVLRDIGVTYFADLKTADDKADKKWTAAQRYSLVVHVADITRGRVVRLPWEYHEYGLEPDHQRIVDAVRASMSIPFFFEPIRFRAPATNGYEAGWVTWVDGGLLDNFPVDVFDRTDGAPARWPTIGVKLSARLTSLNAPKSPDNVFEEAQACLTTLLDNANRYYIDDEKAARTIFVDNAGIKATDFDLSSGQQATLLRNGLAAGRTWVEDRRQQAAAAGATALQGS
ncbi:MAG: patatin-like phospholipase family protein [Pseudonocardiaceae bacterium]